MTARVALVLQVFGVPSMTLSRFRRMAFYPGAIRYDRRLHPRYCDRRGASATANVPIELTWTGQI